jgi:hypothetical protein
LFGKVTVAVDGEGALDAPSVHGVEGDDHADLPDARGPLTDGSRTSLRPLRRDSLIPMSNARPSLSALGGTRTPNLLIRSQMLYPIELQAPATTQERTVRPAPGTAGHPTWTPDTTLLGVSRARVGTEPLQRGQVGGRAQELDEGGVLTIARRCHLDPARGQ